MTSEKKLEYGNRNNMKIIFHNRRTIKYVQMYSSSSVPIRFCCLRADLILYIVLSFEIDQCLFFNINSLSWMSMAVCTNSRYAWILLKDLLNPKEKTSVKCLRYPELKIFGNVGLYRILCSELNLRIIGKF